MARKSVSKKGTTGKRRKLSPEAAKHLPYPDFPLSPHLPSNRWYKVTHGTRHYFGPLDDPGAALEKYQTQRDDLYAGRKFREPGDGYTVRQQRNARPPRMFTAEVIRALMAEASVPMRAMMLLGINCGFGNTDCAELPLSALDLEAGSVDFPRPKTGVVRRAPLWAETVQALREVLAQRREPKDEVDAHRVFITKHGTAWVRYHTNGDPNKPRGCAVDNVSREFQKLKAAAGVNGEGRGFYALRHTFETIAGETGDQKAVDFIMGHAPGAGDMSAVYREWIGDERERARLERVTDHVRAWLYPPAPSSAVRAIPPATGFTA